MTKDDPESFPEPLRSAMQISIPTPPSIGFLRPVPRPHLVGEIDRLIRYDRVKAASIADRELRFMTGEMLAVDKPPPRVPAEFLLFLGAWGASRAAVGLHALARRSFFHALKLAERDTCSSICAQLLERAADHFPDTRPTRILDSALALHVVTGDDDAHVARCLARMGIRLTTPPFVDLRRARGTFETALERMPAEHSFERFAVVRALVGVYLRSGRRPKAAQILRTIDIAELAPPTRRTWALAQADLIQYKRRKLSRRVLPLLLEAAELAARECGPECLLEDVIRMAQLDPPFGGVLEDLQSRVEALLACLVATVSAFEDLEWEILVHKMLPQRLGNTPLSEATADTIRARLLTLQQRQVNRTEEG